MKFIVQYENGYISRTNTNLINEVYIDEYSIEHMIITFMQQFGKDMLSIHTNPSFICLDELESVAKIDWFKATKFSQV